MEHTVKRLKMDFLNKWFNKISYLDLQITRNLKDAGYETRPVQSNGLWCPLLLPLTLVLYTWTCEVSMAYEITAFVSLGLLSYSILFIAFLTISCIVIKESIYGGCTASSLISALLVYTLVGQELVFSLLVAISSTFSYSYLLRICLNKFPRTFTVGEAMVVSQGVILFTAAVGSTLVDENNYHEETKLINTFIYVEYITVGIIVTTLIYLKSDQRRVNVLFKIATLGVVFILGMLCCILGPASIPRLIYYIFLYEINRIKLIGLWLFLVVLAAFALIMRTKNNKKADTVTRKIFHILASLVFLVGIITDLSLIKLAAGVGFGLLIFVEAVRKSCIQPLSSMLQTAFIVYGDEKDCGSFAMTPIYLYVGLACPLLLVPHSNMHTLELLSGVLSIGIGDSAASWIGSKYGRVKWPGSSRTVEGTAGNILSQVALVYLLDTFGTVDRFIQANVGNSDFALQNYLHSKQCLIRALVASTITSLIEAETEQVDNLILPLVTLISYRFTWFML